VQGLHDTLQFVHAVVGQDEPDVEPVNEGLPNSFGGEGADVPGRTEKMLLLSV
jgi:hypothetical protein